MVKQARALETRQRVLRAAAELFDHKGYEATTLNDIVVRSGMTKGAVYFHFPSKATIAVEIVDRLFEAWQPMAETIARREGDALDRLIELSFALSRLYRDDVIVRAAVRLASTREVVDEARPMPYLNWERAAAGLLREAVEQGTVSPLVSADAMGRLLIAFFAGSQHVSEVLSGRKDVEERLVVMWETILPVLTGAAPTRRNATLDRLASEVPPVAG
jgi:AcrR family transcriptional regulator